MKLVTYNIQYGFGLDGRYDLERITRNVQGADIIALQEVTRGSPANENADMVAAIETLLPDYFSVFGPSFDVHAETVVEGDLRVSRRHQVGNMILSRWPILAVRTLLLPRSLRLSSLNLQRGATEGVIDTPFGPLRIYSLHLDHFSPDERICQIRYLMQRVDAHLRDGGTLTGGGQIGLVDPPLPQNYVLMGDFNMEPKSPEYLACVCPTNATSHSVLVDALDVMGWHQPDRFSWQRANEASIRAHVDYCFLSQGLVDRLSSAHVAMDAAGSDHFPVWTELR